jgi:hypothetical protein
MTNEEAAKAYREYMDRLWRAGAPGAYRVTGYDFSDEEVATDYAKPSPLARLITVKCPHCGKDL